MRINNNVLVPFSWIGVFSITGFIVFHLLTSFYFGYENDQQDFAAALEINNTSSNTNPNTGETFIYTIQYSCVSTTDDCIGTVITDPLPPALEFVSLSGSGHTTNEVYDSESHTVTFTFQNTLTAGTSGAVQIIVRFPNGTSLGGLTVTNTAIISASNAITVSNTGNIIVTGATFLDTIPDGTSYVAGSTTVNGSPLSDDAGLMPFVSGGLINSTRYSAASIIAGSDVTIRFWVLVDCCPGSATISNQGSVNFNGAAAVLSDDPTIAGMADPTLRSVSNLGAPMITTAATNLTLDCDTVTNTTAVSDWLSSYGGALATVDCGNVNWSNGYNGLTDGCGASSRGPVKSLPFAID